MSCIIILLLAVFTSALGQDYSPQWIYAPHADSTSHIWYRKAFISKERPKQATITVTSTGYYKLYVNECNIGTAVYYPAKDKTDSSAVTTTLDITAYLRQDTNVVAIVYSPSFPAISQRQIAVSVYGKDTEGKSFCYTTDGSWLCQRANSRLQDDGKGEIVDGRTYDPEWKAATIPNQALWMPAMTYYDNSSLPLTSHKAMVANHIMDWSFYNDNKSRDSMKVDYSFYGFPRVTIREAKRGEKIRINNLLYICNGEIDEQAFPLFNTAFFGNISISGKTNIVTTIEAIELKQQLLENY